VSRYRIEPLQARHAVEAFDCGEEPLNRFLVRFALANQRAREPAAATWRSMATSSLASTRWWWVK
jgi:hypothetical protein